MIISALTLSAEIPLAFGPAPEVGLAPPQNLVRATEDDDELWGDGLYEVEDVFNFGAYTDITVHDFDVAQDRIETELAVDIFSREIRGELSNKYNVMAEVGTGVAVEAGVPSWFVAQGQARDDIAIYYVNSDDTVLDPFDMELVAILDDVGYDNLITPDNFLIG